MCGIAGVLVLDRSMASSREGMLSTLGRMTEAIAHRGPDDLGLWVSDDGCVALGHRRLSIVDLSDRGHQPMHFGGRYSVVFNGEIYNFRELRRELEAAGHSFHSDTDTEVLLAATCEWGIEKTLQSLNGMFAFGLWDREQRVLHLARDRLGEKPLFLHSGRGCLYFGSELRALESIPVLQLQESPEALASYLQRGYVPSPLTPWTGIWKLPAGHLLSIPAYTHLHLTSQLLDGGSSGNSRSPRRFWAVPSPEMQEAASTPRPVESVVDELEALLDSSVRMQMQCDVPMGAFLSGGIDSSAVVASMQRQSDRPVSTFTVRFEGHGFDEADHAARIAHHLQTDHHEIRMTPEALVRSVPAIAARLDEPTGNASYFPLHMMATEARAHVKVILTGDGGDELLGGYNRYLLTPSMWRRIEWMPTGVRRLIAYGLEHSASSGALGKVASAFSSADKLVQTDPGIAALKFVRMLKSSSLREAYDRLMRCWDDPSDVTAFPFRAADLFAATPWTQRDFIVRASASDLMAYLPDDNLSKSDRATMSAGLEARAPLLDFRLVEFASRLPEGLRIRDGEGKWPLRQLVYRRIPRKLIDRPKMGFTAPIRQWLKGPLQAWAHDLLTSDTLYRSGLIDRKRLLAHWHRFVGKDAPLAWEIWTTVIYAAWLHGRSASCKA